jgi:FkbM family methyltransferase
MYKGEFHTKYGKLTCFLNDIVFYSSLRNGKIYEEELIINNIIPLLNNKEDNKVILDIGSHIGSHTILYSRLVKNSEIYSFEPQKEIFNLLKENVINNNLLNVKIFNNAVGHIITDTNMSNFLYDGYDCKIEYNTSKTLNYGGIGLGENGEKVKMITIDSLELNKCDYIKIDVEGSEILVLMGGINTILKFKPIIWFEKTDKKVTDEMKRNLKINFELKDTCDVLTNIGYNLYKIDDCNYLALYFTN